MGECLCRGVEPASVAELLNPDPSGVGPDRREQFVAQRQSGDAPAERALTALRKRLRRVCSNERDRLRRDRRAVGRNGGPPRQPDFARGAEIQAVLDAAFESNRRDGPVMIC